MLLSLVTINLIIHKTLRRRCIIQLGDFAINTAYLLHFTPFLSMVLMNFTSPVTTKSGMVSASANVAYSDAGVAAAEKQLQAAQGETSGERSK
jgi:hypothetical protein